MIPKKMDKETANQLKILLAKMNVTNRKVTIDLDNETIGWKMITRSMIYWSLRSVDSCSS